MPSAACVSTNAHALARYAAICQEQGLVPIIEPEVLMEGSHDAQRCYAVPRHRHERDAESLRVLEKLPTAAVLKEERTDPCQGDAEKKCWRIFVAKDHDARDHDEQRRGPDDRLIDGKIAAHHCRLHADIIKKQPKGKGQDKGPGCTNRQ